MAERQQCLDGGGMEYIIAGWVREMRSERWQHEILHSYCVDEDEDDDGSFNDTPNGSNNSNHTADENKAHWQYVWSQVNIYRRPWLFIA